MAHSEATIGWPSDLWVELTEVLKRYGLPEGTTSLVLRAKIDDVITVECNFTPFAEAAAPAPPPRPGRVIHRPLAGGEPVEIKGRDVAE